jgi:hypothetical protein
VTKDEALAQLAQSWNNLANAIEGLPVDRMSEPSVTGEWSVKDLLGHVAFWDRFSVTQAERRLAGIPKDPPHDFQALNEDNHQARAEWKLSDIQTELKAAHASLIAAYSALPNFDQIAIDEDWTHYDEHADDIRNWRERKGI